MPDFKHLLKKHGWGSSRDIKTPDSPHLSEAEMEANNAFLSSPEGNILLAMNGEGGKGVGGVPVDRHPDAVKLIKALKGYGTPTERADIITGAKSMLSLLSQKLATSEREWGKIENEWHQRVESDKQSDEQGIMRNDLLATMAQGRSIFLSAQSEYYGIIVMAYARHEQLINQAFNENARQDRHPGQKPGAERQGQSR